MSRLKRYSTCHNEPDWQYPGALQQQFAPQALLPWLLDPTSLTARLRHVCDGQFSVRLLEQFWGRPQPGEAQLTDLKPGERALIRQVHLCCDGRPLVFARTVIPRSTLIGRCARLARLGTRPLGEVLFSDPSMRRSQLQIARILKGNAVHAEALAENAPQHRQIWGRRSVFHLNQRPLLVSEIFLPQMPAFPWELA